jgi:ATP-binding cassette subfamily F protein uup
LILDEPTNDLDIATLNVLEEYLEDFNGCVIVVSHDRYFMDKIVDHLLVFKGNAEIVDFPGNYTQYRSMPPETAPESDKKKPAAAANAEPASSRRVDRKPKLTYKEKMELAELEETIERLETEKGEIETAMCSGEMSATELTELSKRYPLLCEEIEEKTMRWMELSEKS